MKGEVKGRGKKLPLLPRGEGGWQEEPSWENSCQDQFLGGRKQLLTGGGSSGFGLGTLINNSVGTNQRIEAAETQNFGCGEAEARRDLFWRQAHVVDRTLE